MTGTYYDNYKVFNSLVLLAICDSNNCFTLFSNGLYGSSNDSGVLSKSEMKKMIEKNELFIPPTLTFKSCVFDSLPYFLVKDEIFPLKT